MKRIEAVGEMDKKRPVPGGEEFGTGPIPQEEEHEKGFLFPAIVYNRR